VTWVSLTRDLDGRGSGRMGGVAGTGDEVSEELEVLKAVTGRLEAARIPYMVTGSMALNYYAVPRMTRDIDLVVELSVIEVDHLTDLFLTDFDLDAAAVRAAIDRQGTFNLIHTELAVKVDFVVRKNSEYRRLEFTRRREVSFEGHRFSIVAPEDLVISKLDWARDTRSEVQLGDVRNLLRALPDVDRTYVEHWVGQLGLDALYRGVSA
jgi:hypothetical protein